VAGIEVVDVAHAIQLAVAPIFLLSGVGVILLSMISLVVALIAFLLEVRIAIAVLRIGSW
jgi:hypothetical protein